MIDRQTALSGGYRSILSEALPAVSSSTAIFANAPAGTCFVTLTIRGGTLAINYGAVDVNGTPVPAAATAANGNDYPAGTYEIANVVDSLKACRAIGASVTSGWITYFGVR